MQSKLKTTEEAAKILELFNRRTGLRPNIICRLSVSRSLQQKEKIDFEEYSGMGGREFNRPTLTGEYDILFKALISEWHEKKLSDEEYFSKYLKAHIERGVRLLAADYKKAGTTDDFLIKLVSA